MWELSEGGTEREYTSADTIECLLSATTAVQSFLSADASGAQSLALTSLRLVRCRVIGHALGFEVMSRTTQSALTSLLTSFWMASGHRSTARRGHRNEVLTASTVRTFNRFSNLSNTFLMVTKTL